MNRLIYWLRVHARRKIAERIAWALGESIVRIDDCDACDMRCPDCRENDRYIEAGKRLEECVGLLDDRALERVDIRDYYQAITHFMQSVRGWCVRRYT